MSKVSEEQVKNAIEEIKYFTVYDKCTIVVAKLKNGFILTESSGAVSKENYDLQIGLQTCLRKIYDEIWKLEGYKLQDSLDLKKGDECCGTDNGTSC